jgi:hypothetical protein
MGHIIFITMLIAYLILRLSKFYVISRLFLILTTIIGLIFSTYNIFIVEADYFYLFDLLSSIYLINEIIFPSTDKGYEDVIEDLKTLRENNKRLRGVFIYLNDNTPESSAIEIHKLKDLELFIGNVDKLLNKNIHSINKQKLKNSLLVSNNLIVKYNNI